MKTPKLDLSQSSGGLGDREEEEESVQFQETPIETSLKLSSAMKGRKANLLESWMKWMGILDFDKVDGLRMPRTMATEQEWRKWHMIFLSFLESQSFAKDFMDYSRFQCPMEVKTEESTIFEKQTKRSLNEEMDEAALATVDEKAKKIKKTITTKEAVIEFGDHKYLIYGIHPMFL